MGCEQWSEPISAYVDGECDRAERSRVSEHLVGCRTCRSEVERADRMRRRHLLVAADSSEGLRAAILMAHERTTVRTRLRRRALVGVAASSLAVLGGAVALGTADGDRTPTGSGHAGVLAADHEVVVDAAVTDADHELHIRAGETVAWRNGGAERHALIHEIDGSTVVGNLEPGQSDSITFGNPGSYAYRCAIHEGIAGEVHVTT